MRVLAAVSGGVDSAVAMARAADAGHDVTAVHMALSPDPALTRDGARGCCTISDAHDARRAADTVGVPFYVWDLADTFRETVIADFVSEYEAGRTPNPCVRCNQHVKFAALLDRARVLGFDAVATGHYAVVDPDGPHLRRAADPAKDQSYVLAVLGTERLRHCLFPLGDTTKGEVRAEAARRGLTVAAKPDSHDICFIPDGDTAGFLARKLGERPGDIVDAATGATLGTHSGTYGFTVGQRRGLGLTDPAESGRPRYVLSIEPTTGTVRVGDRDDLAVDRISADAAVWCGPLPAAGAELAVQIRAHGDAVGCRVDRVDDDSFDIRLTSDVFGVAPGQSAVLYQGDRVVGQGTIRTP
ncbi:MAG: tRNA 2-thiouridine(34) synthase MnmA [Candidatus Nanopelagicales bacterium]